MVRILLVRHGESEGNIDPKAYAEKGDQNVGLTDKGWKQAQHAGKFLKSYIAGSETRWPLFFVSAYRRPKETLSGAYEHMKGMFAGKPLLYTDVRLVEQSFGGINHLNLEVLKEGDLKKFAEQFLEISQRTWKKDPITAKTPFGESVKDTLDHTKSFIDGSLSRDIAEGHNTIVIFCHGRTIASILANWFHVPLDQYVNLAFDKSGKARTPGNCDVIEISGRKKKWIARKIWDGEKAKNVDIDPLRNIEKLTFDSLPPVPENLRIK